MCLTKKQWYIITQIGFLGGFLSWVAWYIWEHGHDFAVITQVPLTQILALYGLFFGIVVFNGLYIRDVLLAFNIRLRTKEWLSLTVATSAINFILPLRGGAGFRALYLKSRYRFNFSDFLQTMSVMYIIYLLIHSVMGLLGMSLLWRQGVAFDVPLAVFFAITASTAVICMLWSFPIKKTMPFLLRQIVYIINGWVSLQKKRLLSTRLIIHTIFYALATLTSTKLAFSIYSVDLSWGGAMFQAASQSIALLISFTPGALGIAELMSIYVGRSLSYTTSEALIVQTLLRVISWSTLLVLTPIAMHILNNSSKVQVPSASV
jgi:uncharacterized membrane protein YbhN (UPF0104 family)